MFSESNHTTIAILTAYLNKMRWADGLQLLNLAIAKADLDQVYAKELEKLFNNYTTTDGRDVLACFGEYWKNLKHSNAVDGIDSAFCHLWNVNNGFDSE